MGNKDAVKLFEAKIVSKEFCVSIFLYLCACALLNKFLTGWITEYHLCKKEIVSRNDSIGE
jgi:hypothetical protein